MKILQVHNIYIGKTGEETVVDEEKKILEKHGHEVVQFIKDNSELGSFNLLEKVKMYSSLLSSSAIAQELSAFIDAEKPAVCHVHNTFPIITPVVYEVCQQKGLPVIQTLHNYKLICTNSLMFRDGDICEKCLNKSLYNSVKYKCYRNSYMATAMQARVIQHHRNKGTWEHMIDRYVCLTDFHKQKLVSGGLPAEKISVKPNFFAESGLPIEQEDFFLFVGKIDDYKGLQDLLHLFRHNDQSKFILIGKSEQPEMFDEFANVNYLGEQGREVVLEHMRKCKAVIFPSLYYEGMPMVLLEAFSHKKPVISRDRGAMSSMVIEGHNGKKYEDVSDLVKLVALFDKDDDLVSKLGANAYTEYLEKYSQEQGYKNLITLYEAVIEEKTMSNQSTRPV